MTPVAGHAVPSPDRYLLDVVRRRTDVLWAGRRADDQPPTVIAQDIDAVRAGLPPAAGEDWTWVQCSWSWEDVKAVSMELAQLGGSQIRSMNLGPRDDDTFGIQLELSGSSDEIDAYLASLEPGLVRVSSPGEAPSTSLPAFW